MKIGVGVLLVGLLIIGISFVAPTFQIIGAGGGTGGTTTTYTYSLSGSFYASPTNFNLGSSTTLILKVTGEKNSPTALFEVNGNIVHEAVITSDTIYSYTYTPSSIGTFGTSIVYVSYAEFTSSGSYVVKSTIGGSTLTILSTTPVVPVINSIEGQPNPATVGQTVDFSASINWEGGTSQEVSWYVNNAIISGSSYTFGTAGTYLIEVKATDNNGFATDSFSEVVNSPIITQNYTLTNVGTFYYSYDNSSLKQIGSSNITVVPTTYPVSVSFYYVENNGQTQNMQNVYITYNNAVYQLTKTTDYNGYTTYITVISVQPSVNVVSGFITPISQAHELPVQAFSTELVADQINFHTQPLFNEYTLIAGGVVVVLGLFMIIRRR